MIRTIIFILLLSYPFLAHADCNCGSTDQSSPCTGSSISVTVTANTSNGGTAVDSQYNWSFNSGGSDARCGQFANGDYWIAPAQGQASVTITSITGSGSITADADPRAWSYGLLDGTKAYSGYNASENIIPTLPQSYSAATSLVAAIQRNEAVEGACGTAAILGECVDSYNVVTILPSVPANAGADMIRPNITGTTKELLTFSDFDLSRIPAKSFLTGTNAAGLEEIRRRWSHSVEIFSLNWSTDGGTAWLSNGEAGRGLRSHTLIDDYGAGAANTLHSDLAALFSDDNPAEDKKEAIAAILSYGLDLYHAVLGPDKVYPVRWSSGAGQHLGKFTPVALLAALEKNNPTRLASVKAIAEKASDEQPQELAQLHVGPNGPVWGDEDEGISRYWSDMMWSRCYDMNPDHEASDYVEKGTWKTMSFPVGKYYTGNMHLTFTNSNYAGNNGDAKLRNVSIDGAPINFNSVTLVNYAGATGNGTVEDGGATYSMYGNVSKQTQNTYAITANSVLTFDFYQTVEGWEHTIGFDENNTEDSVRLLQLTGLYQKASFIQIGCNPIVGQKTERDPYGYIDGPANKPGSNYFPIGYAGILNFAAMMHLMPEFKAAVNTTKPIDFVDRARKHGLTTLPDPCVTPDVRENLSVCDVYRSGVNCEYYYPTASVAPTWGPKSLSDASAGCAATPVSGYTQQGRFASLDGTPAPINLSYVSRQLHDNLDVIKEVHSQRRLFRNVSIGEVEP